jgi:hypothetical protein
LNVNLHVKGFTDEFEGELEKCKIVGIPITPKVSLLLLCCMAICIVLMGVGIGAMIAKKENKVAPLNCSQTSSAI